MVSFLAVAFTLLPLFAAQRALGTPTAVGNSIDGLLLHRMFSRQISGVDSIPPECQSACQGIISDALGCSSDSDIPGCICTDQSAADTATCLDCSVAVDKSMSVQDGQKSLDDFVSQCKTNGKTVKSQTIKSVTPTGSDSSSGSGNADTGSSDSGSSGSSSSSGGSNGSSSSIGSTGSGKNAAKMLNTGIVTVGLAVAAVVFAV